MLSEQQIAIIVDIMQPYHPTRIGIFGSVARDEARVDSDIDILYDFGTTPGLLQLVRLKDELENRLGQKVDLVSEKFMHPGLKPYILQDLKMIYGQ